VVAQEQPGADDDAGLYAIQELHEDADDSSVMFTLGFAAGSHNLVMHSDYSELEIK
jgi:hypothetical protein